MKTKTKIILSIAIIMGLLIILYAVPKIFNLTGQAVYGGNLDRFIQCLSDSNVKMYGAYWCSHCQNQKKLFENNPNFISEIYIECYSGGENSQSSLCAQKDIRGYPTWEINNQLYPGEKTFQQLADLSGCSFG